MICTVVGYKRFVSKKSIACNVVEMIVPLSTRDINSFGGVGKKVVEQFISEELADKVLKPDIVGKDFDIAKDFDNQICKFEPVVKK